MDLATPLCCSDVKTVSSYDRLLYFFWPSSTLVSYCLLSVSFSLSVLSSSAYICKISSAMQLCLSSEFFYNQASPANQNIKTNSRDLTTYKRDNSYSFPYSTLNTSTLKWNFTWIHLVTELIENCRSLFSILAQHSIQQTLFLW